MAVIGFVVLLAGAAVAIIVPRATNNPEATTVVPTAPNEPLIRARRNLPAVGGQLRIILVDSSPGATPQDLTVTLLVDFPDQASQTVIAAAQPVEKLGYTFTLVGVHEPDTAILRITNPTGQPLAN